MSNLVAAAGAGGNHAGTFRQGVNQVHQRFCHFQAQGVFVVEGAEGARHAAAAAVEQGRLVPGEVPAQLQHEARVRERLGMAVDMNGQAMFRGAQFQGLRFPLQQVFDKMLEKDRSFRGLRGAVQAQFPILFTKHGVAGGFQEKDRPFGPPEQVEVAPAETPRDVEPSHAEGGPAAAGVSLDQAHGIPGGFEHGNGRLADTGFVVAHEAIVPKQHGSPAGRPAIGSFSEPGVKALLGVFGQGPLGRDADYVFQQRPERVVPQGRIGESREGASQDTEQVHAAQHAGIQRHPVLAVARMEQFRLEQGHVHV